MLSEKEDGYCKPKIVINFWNNNYIEYERNCGRIDDIFHFFQDIKTV